jgi:hypothetical protein
VKTLDIEIEVIKGFNPRQNIIVTNVSWGIVNAKYKALHECDVLILSGSGYATEVEIKVSKADLLKDGEKKHHHNHNLIRRFYYAVPKELEQVALETIPDHAGLIIITKISDARRNRLTWVKQCKPNKEAVKWTDNQRMQLARLGTMRILGLKQKIQKLS